MSAKYAAGWTVDCSSSSTSSISKKGKASSQFFNVWEVAAGLRSGALNIDVTKVMIGVVSLPMIVLDWTRTIRILTSLLFCGVQYVDSINLRSAPWKTVLKCGLLEQPTSGWAVYWTTWQATNTKPQCHTSVPPRRRQSTHFSWVTIEQHNINQPKIMLNHVWPTPKLIWHNFTSLLKSCLSL